MARHKRSKSSNRFLQKKHVKTKKIQAAAMISDHFTRKEFACQCGNCKSLVKVSLGLVGGLELLCENLGTKVTILKGFECADSAGKSKDFKKNYHKSGVAVELTCDTLDIKTVFKAAEQVPEFKALGLNISKNSLYIDLRKDDARHMWVIESDKQTQITPENYSRYLGE